MQVNKVRVVDIKVEDITPRLKGEAGKLLPTELSPARCSFELHGVNIAIANAIRRVVLSEVRVKSLGIAYDDFETNDPHANLYNYVEERICAIPIMQSVPTDLVLKLDVINNTKDVFHAYAKDFEYVSGGGAAGKNIVKKLCSSTAQIVALSSEKYIRIPRIYITEGYGLSNALYTVAHSATSIPIDVEMYEMYERTGVSANVSDPRKFKLSFETNGTIDCHTLMSQVCDEIIARLNKVEELNYTMQKIDDRHMLKIDGENDTIGAIITRTLNDLYPTELEFNYDVNFISKHMRVFIRSDEPTNHISIAVKRAIDVFKKIKTFF